MTPPDIPYRRADLYDLAFSFREVGRECDFLLAAAAEHGRGCRSFLEVACGPGYHVVEMAHRGIRAAGLDLQDEMLTRLRQKADTAGVCVETISSDMRAFEAAAPFDVAAILMDSASLLLGTEDLRAHLQAMAGALTPGGIYVLEMAHPSNHFGTARTSDNHWTTEKDELVLTTTWGLPEDPFDALTQTGDVTVVWEVEHPDGTRERFEDHERTHKWTKAHFELVVEQDGAFDLVAWYGSLDTDVPLSLAKAAWRMVPVLRRRSDR